MNQCQSMNSDEVFDQRARDFIVRRPRATNFIVRQPTAKDFIVRQPGAIQVCEQCNRKSWCASDAIGTLGLRTVQSEILVGKRCNSIVRDPRTKNCIVRQPKKMNCIACQPEFPIAPFASPKFRLRRSHTRISGCISRKPELLRVESSCSGLANNEIRCSGSANDELPCPLVEHFVRIH